MRQLLRRLVSLRKLTLPGRSGSSQRSLTASLSISPTLYKSFASL